MIVVNLVCVGAIKEKYFVEAQNEYVKRLGRFCKINVMEVKPAVSGKTEREQIIEETENIKNACKGFVCAFDRRGEEISSEGLAKLFDKLASQGISEICFVIGGSFGMSEDFIEKTNKTISFGKITLPHTLARVVALEQIYRAFTINNNIAYHK